MPALAPIRQRGRPRSARVPPPDSVPMIEAPPPTSEPVADDDAGRDAALDHRRAERAGVVVDEALVHDRRALGQVRAEADPVGVGDAHAGGQHVVGHPRELVDAEDLHRALAAQRQPGALEVLDRARPEAGPHDVGQQAEDAVEVDAVRATSRCESRCRRR